MQGFRVVKVIPTEAETSACDLDEIGAYCQTLEQLIRDFLAWFIINFDEASDQEWVDAHAENVIVPSGDKGKTICMPVSQSSQRSTLFGDIRADGRFLKRIVIMGDKPAKQNSSSSVTHLTAYYPHPNRMVYYKRSL
jgi:hypothetical protein